VDGSMHVVDGSLRIGWLFWLTYNSRYKQEKTEINPSKDAIDIFYSLDDFRRDYRMKQTFFHQMFLGGVASTHI